MKKIFKNIGIITLTMLVFASCKKDEEKLSVTAGEAPALAVSTNTLVLTPATASDTVITFSWNKQEVTWSTPANATDITTYTLEIDSAGQNFASPYDVDFTGFVKGKYTGADFNALMVSKVNLPSDVASHIELRLKTSIAPNQSPVYSNVVSLTVTPYVVIPEYVSLYVAGSHQGWAPSTAPAIGSVKDDGTYEGFVNFPDASTDYKLTSARDWNNTNYGDGGTGLLSTTGGNITQAGAGYYYIKADINKMTVSAEKTAWAVIGAATSGGWDTETALTYDINAKVWKATVNLTAGEFKFRANNAWALNMGASTIDGVLKIGSNDNLSVSDAGSYTITLDLSHPAYYMYKLKKN
ncbi:SusE domain-containing protein [Arcticibacter eurypsychrophilus]|uniref:SusE domain-containing protein n=1 Tax=Arcticibacter eurypsychrophilus TaxID=1434752 RepID=UPI00084D24EA|nr:SusE domain-containing protein [Arcticibacter eurypsychrophilus]